jgi:hypothetical protein
LFSFDYRFGIKISECRNRKKDKKGAGFAGHDAKTQPEIGTDGKVRTYFPPERAILLLKGCG